VAWPTCGEIELYEARTGPDIKTNPCSEPSVPNVAGDNCFIATCHYGVNGTPSYHCGQRNYPACLCDRYHTYGVLWDSTHVEYYFDDTLYWGPNFPTGNGTPSITLPGNTTAFHNPFYWIMNVAVGGAYQGQQINNAIFPQKMNIDYVKVYQKGTTGINNIAAGHPLRSFGLVNPSSARLKVYDMSGRLVADYSARVRSMKPGDDALRSMSPPLPNGAYIAALVDKGNSISKKFAVAR
jgi:beta-glucanase (GH16 family)